ncbi:MAG: HipA N-terminal domain-containing protein [Oligoflexia bacterium]|nr:HipA N-terminal domain-containing protein [Oligoflexia bacterium]
MSKRGKVFVDNDFAGIIEQREGAFIFTYDDAYLRKKGVKPISLTLPLRLEAYEQKTMFAFFDGLIPEGWLLNIIENNWKIDPRDRMSLLLLACRDCIGNVMVINDQAEENQ